MCKKLEMNMLRDRAKPLQVVEEEMFKACNSENIDLVTEYLQTSNNLSKQTLKQYKSGLYQFVYYIHENLNDKPFNKITKRDFRRYMSYLMNRGLSSSALKFKKSAVSAFCKYIENVIAEEEDNYSRFRNFTTGTGDIPKNQVYNKLPITEDEYNLMIETLEADGNLLGKAWVTTMYFCGCRRSEIIQFRTELLNYDLGDKKYIISHKVRGKGRGEDGKILEYLVPIEALNHMRGWVESRGYESQHVFTVKHRGEIQQMGAGWSNRFCEDVLSDIVGRRINVHLFKASAITRLLEQGKSMEVVSKYIAHHNDMSTTQQHYDLRDDTKEKDNIFS